jgi:Cof subfamily protein (haloacid dehalogenase superfamily)
VIKLAALDMDGTLLNSRTKISKFSLETIKKAQDAGVRVAICTGRFPENVKIILDDLNAHCDIIALNGAVVDTEGKRIHQAFLPPETCIKIFEKLEEHDATYVMFRDHKVITRKEDTMYHAEAQYGERLKLEYGVTFERGFKAAEQAVKAGVSKFFVFDTEDALNLNKLYDEVSTICEVDVTRSGPYNFEVMPKGMGKGVGLRKLAEYYNISMAETMAVGDHENDTAMIEEAGLSVAMGNAIKQIKDMADYITDTNDNDGAAKAIIKFALQEEVI